MWPRSIKKYRSTKLIFILTFIRQLFPTDYFYWIYEVRAPSLDFHITVFQNYLKKLLNVNVRADQGKILNLRQSPCPGSTSKSILPYNFYGLHIAFI